MKKPLGSVTDSEYDAQPDSCEICGAVGGLDRHHVVPRRMGGTKDPDVHDESNLMTLCRACHSNIHEARWELIRSAEGFQVVDSKTGEQIMRRFHNPGVDVPTLFQILNLAEESLSQLQDTLPYLTDDQLTEAFVYARSFGKRSWLAQAAILYEAQRRGTYGERTMEAVARGFEIGLRQAQKYALVWKTFFLQHEEEENVNIDAILLDEPSWYVVAVTETKEPEKWLAYAQDRKIADSRYSVTTFRRDIVLSRFHEGVISAKEMREPEVALPDMRRSWACPWVKLYCTQSGVNVPFRECTNCEFVDERR